MVGIKNDYGQIVGTVELDPLMATGSKSIRNLIAEDKPKKLHIRISPYLKERIKSLAEQEGKSMSRYCVEILRKHYDGDFMLRREAEAKYDWYKLAVVAMAVGWASTFIYLMQGRG